MVVDDAGNRSNAQMRQINDRQKDSVSPATAAAGTEFNAKPRSSKLSTGIV